MGLVVWFSLISKPIFKTTDSHGFYWFLIFLVYFMCSVLDGFVVSIS